MSIADIFGKNSVNSEENAKKLYSFTMGDFDVDSQQKVIELLEEGVDPVHVHERVWECTAEYGVTEIARLLIAIGCRPRLEKDVFGSLLDKALLHGSDNVAMLLIGQNVYDVRAARTTIYAALGENMRSLSMLKSMGVNFNAADDAGITPFLRAVSRGKKESVRFLMENGCDINAVCKRHKGYREWAMDPESIGREVYPDMIDFVDILAAKLAHEKAVNNNRNAMHKGAQNKIILPPRRGLK